MCHSSAYAAVKDLLAEEESEQRAGNATATEKRRGEKRGRIDAAASGSPTRNRTQAFKGGASRRQQCFQLQRVKLASREVRRGRPCLRGYLFKKEVSRMKAAHVFSLLGNKLCVV